MVNCKSNVDHPTVAHIVDWLDRFAPSDLAADWDNVGLLLGDRNVAIRGVLTCLTWTPDVAAEAIADDANFIVTHHPILFRPIQRLTADTTDGRMLLELARAGVAVYSQNTAFDNTAGGINDMLATRLGLADVKPLRSSEEPRCKIVVFVPENDLPKVSDAMFAAGAGIIGQYRECGFRIAGTGTFFATDATNPTVGRKGRREDVAEWRLEMICAEADVGRAVSAMRAAHSYEEPAFDVYQLRTTAGTGGLGRIGKLPIPTTLAQLVELVKRSLNAHYAQIVGDKSQPIQSVAIVCGSGGEFLKDAATARADAFLTGEMRFHDCLTARDRKVGVILPGHFATERFALNELARMLQNAWPSVNVWASRVESDPLALI